MEELIMTLILLTVIYFIFRNTFYKNKSFRVLIIFSVVFNLFIVLLNIGNFIRDEVSLLYYLTTIIYGVLITGISLTVTYFKEVKNADTKVITIKHKTIKFYRLTSLLALVADGLIVGMMFIFDSKFDGYKIVHIVIFSLILLWNIFYNIYFIKNKVKGESIIIVTNNSYAFYEVNEKYSYTLNDYIDNEQFSLDRTIIGLYKTPNNDNRYIRVFYVSKYRLNNQNIDKVIFNTLKNWQHPTIILDVKEDIN